MCAKCCIYTSLYEEEVSGFRAIGMWLVCWCCMLLAHRRIKRNALIARGSGGSRGLIPFGEEVADRLWAKGE